MPPHGAPAYPSWARLLRWLQAVRVGPIVQTGRCIGLPRFAQHVVALDTWWKLCSLIARVLSERGKAILE